MHTPHGQFRGSKAVGSGDVVSFCAFLPIAPRSIAPRDSSVPKKHRNPPTTLWPVAVLQNRLSSH
jgi:hypothetical protein